MTVSGEQIIFLLYSREAAVALDPTHRRTLPRVARGCIHLRRRLHRLLPILPRSVHAINRVLADV